MFSPAITPEQEKLRARRLCANPFCLGLNRYPHIHAEMISEAWQDEDYDPARARLILNGEPGIWNTVSNVFELPMVGEI